MKTEGDIPQWLLNTNQRRERTRASIGIPNENNQASLAKRAKMENNNLGKSRAARFCNLDFGLLGRAPTHHSEDRIGRRRDEPSPLPHLSPAVKTRCVRADPHARRARGTHRIAPSLDERGEPCRPSDTDTSKFDRSVLTCHCYDFDDRRALVRPKHNPS